MASLDGAGFLPRGIVGLLSATGGTGKTYFLLSLGVAAAAGRAFGPIRILKPTSTLIVCGEDDQAEVTRRVWDIAGGEFPPNLYGVSTVGRLGPLMELQNGRPTRTAAFAWLEETIENHPGLELLILDPKSRFYGLEENDNGHATQFIQALEYLSQKHRLTILLSTHTGKALAGRNSQEMNRGASALVDGCRWQAGLVRMDKGMAEGLGINDPRRYVVLDLPKSNYGAHLQRPLILKRGENGVLTFCDPAADRFNALGTALLDLLRRDPKIYTRRELKRDKRGLDLVADLKEAFPSFNPAKDLDPLVDALLSRGVLRLEVENLGRTTRENLIPA